MTSEAMEEKLWTVSNAVTGFAILQSVAFLYAAAGDGFKSISLASQFAKFGVAFACVLCGAVYCLAVWRCYQMALSVGVEHKQIWKETTMGRILAIVVFQTLNLLGLLGLPYSS
jgi:hypothetical protein